MVENNYFRFPAFRPPGFSAAIFSQTIAQTLFYGASKTTKPGVYRVLYMAETPTGM